MEGESGEVWLVEREVGEVWLVEGGTAEVGWWTEGLERLDLCL